MLLPIITLEDKALNPITFENTILEMYRGSVAHGMYVPNTDPNSIDDVDLMTVNILDPRYYYTYDKHVSRYQRKGTRNCFTKGTEETMQENAKKTFLLDIVSYELTKYLHLLTVGNPNVISTIWLKPELYLKRTSISDTLITNRDKFSSKEFHRASIGYAYGQMHRMDHTAGNGYMGEKRKKLVERFGYDTKNAAHLIRLLRMDLEFLTEGKLIVDRNEANDAEELLAIKKGKLSRSEVMDMANDLQLKCEKAAQTTDIPTQPDLEWIRDFSVEVLTTHLSK